MRAGVYRWLEILDPSNSQHPGRRPIRRRAVARSTGQPDLLFGYLLPMRLR